jgi:hypothetical protein
VIGVLVRYSPLTLLSINQLDDTVLVYAKNSILKLIGPKQILVAQMEAKSSTHGQFYIFGATISEFNRCYYGMTQRKQVT